VDRGPSSLPLQLQLVLVLFLKDRDKGKVQFTNLEVVVVKLKVHNQEDDPILAAIVVGVARPIDSILDLLSHRRGEVKHFLDDRVPLVVLCSLLQLYKISFAKNNIFLTEFQNISTFYIIYPIL
jgi:hypothetical protein